MSQQPPHRIIKIDNTLKLLNKQNETFDYPTMLTLDLMQTPTAIGDQLLKLSTEMKGGMRTAEIIMHRTTAKTIAIALYNAAAHYPSNQFNGKGAHND